MNILKGERKYEADFGFESGEKFERVPRWISLGKGLGPKGKAGKRIL